MMGYGHIYIVGYGRAHGWFIRLVRPPAACEQAPQRAVALVFELVVSSVAVVEVHGSLGGHDKAPTARQPCTILRVFTVSYSEHGSTAECVSLVHS